MVKHRAKLINSQTATHLNSKHQDKLDLRHTRYRHYACNRGTWERKLWLTKPTTEDMSSGVTRRTSTQVSGENPAQKNGFINYDNLTYLKEMAQSRDEIEVRCCKDKMKMRVHTDPKASHHCVCEAEDQSRCDQSDISCDKNTRKSHKCLCQSFRRDVNNVSNFEDLNMNSNISHQISPIPDDLYLFICVSTEYGHLGVGSYVWLHIARAVSRCESLGRTVSQLSEEDPSDSRDGSDFVCGTAEHAGNISSVRSAGVSAAARVTIHHHIRTGIFICETLLLNENAQCYKTTSEKIERTFDVKRQGQINECITKWGAKIKGQRFVLNIFEILGSVLYLYFILVRLCIPVFMNKSSQAFSTRTLILALFHATFPGLVEFDLFHKLLSHLEHRRTRLALLLRLSRLALAVGSEVSIYGNTLYVFALSALVHEYVFTLGFGFFYPVMFCTFAGIGAEESGVERHYVDVFVHRTGGSCVSVLSGMVRPDSLPAYREPNTELLRRRKTLANVNKCKLDVNVKKTSLIIVRKQFWYGVV
ncbi:Sterol O-acyltransferase 1 [Triplophysa tibetana]|uniref:Sterol O-acyltransferase 1 n=1 Tax=Triplophysa tibetana TaxID=1572043 RepID=A0A5A9NUB6_9TELE|nr:Sterol O-acyltransferase 1 [Triplophysa tibetana]